MYRGETEREQTILMKHAGWVLAALGMVALCGSRGAAQGSPRLAELDKQLREVAALPGEPHLFESAGVSRQDMPLRSLESTESLDGPKRRLVIVGGLDGDDRGVRATLGALRWFKTSAPAALKQAWSVVALPCGNPEGWVESKPTNNSFGKPNVGYPPPDGFFNDRKNVEARYIWRWIAFQAPDAVLEIAGGNRVVWRVPPAYLALGKDLKAYPLVSPDTLPMALSKDAPSGLGAVPSLQSEARAEQGPEVLQAALRAFANVPRSPMRQAVVRRLTRSPLEVGALLAAKYPQEPSITYIPAVAWTSTLRLAELRNDPALRAKVREAAAPYLNGGRPSLDGNPDTTKLAGHILFADLAQGETDEAVREQYQKLAVEAARLYLPENAGETARHGRLWTDDMFMTYTLLGRAGKLSGDSSHLDLLARTAMEYIEKLQRPDGFFNHAADAPHAWGRGNGFAALGLVEALTYLPASHPQRPAIVESFQGQMAALKKVQTPLGTWRQVIDRPESYREVTATAMNLAAMARGLRMGWLDRSYLPVAERAWKGLTVRIADDGTLVDVCDGTGAGAQLRHYYDRPAIFGPNDRGGAMSLLAAVEMAELQARK